MTSLAQTLESAWAHRWNQRIEPALHGLAEAQASAGWAELGVEDWRKNGEREQYLEALLLKASLLRAQGFRQKSSALLAKILARAKNENEPLSFRLLFELGLDHWIDQDLARALEYFLLAEKKARNDLERLFSSSNVLWCLEALDLERRDSERKVEALLRKQEQSAEHVSQMWSAYLLRKNFYQSMALPEDKLAGQSGFFAQWASLLPYVTGGGALALDPDYLWQGSYRLRTLARIWIPADQYSVRLGDAIDRLYLWVWLAMAARPEMTKEKIFYTLESILHDFDFENQSRENLLLFRNALAWVVLLYPSQKSRLAHLGDRLSRVNGENYPVLEAEFDLMAHLTGLAPPGAKPLFERFPAFRKIYQDMQGALPFLQEKLTPLQAKARHYDLVIDQVREEILLPAKGKLVPSRGITKLLSLLAEKEEVPVEQLGEFEPFNLLYRARKLLGPNTISLKRNRLSRGTRWPRTLLLQGDDLPAFEIQALKPNVVESDAHLQAARALFPGAFRRKDLEKRLVVSKATANRMIEKWLEEKKLFAAGRAKATVYRWMEEKL